MKTLISKQVKNVTVALEFKLQDLWVGAFWHRKRSILGSEQHIWICLLPCLPIHIMWSWPLKKSASKGMGCGSTCPPK